MTKKTSKFDEEGAREQANEDLYSAETLVAAIEAAARGLWAKNYGQACPENRVPSIEDLEGFAPPQGAMREYTARCLALRRTYDPDGNTPEAWFVMPGTGVRIRISGHLDNVDGVLAKVPGFAIPDLQSAFTAWKHDDRRGKNPIAPIIEEWQSLQGIDPDRREYGILSQSVRDCPAVITDPWGEALTEISPGPVSDGGQLPIFDHYPDDGVRVPPILQLFSTDGYKPIVLPNGATPLCLVLHTEILLSLPYVARKAGGLRVNLTLRELRDWAYKPGAFRMDRHFPEVVRNLQALHNILISVPGGYFNVVAVREWPERDLNSRIRLDVEHPPGMFAGAQIHREKLREYARQKMRRYHAWASISEYWDRYGTHDRKIIHATRPEVLRNEAGYIVDIHGKPLTKKGKPVTSNWDPRAIRTGQNEPNPMRDRYPFLSPDQVVVMVFGRDSLDGQTVKVSAATVRDRRRRARETLEKIEQDGNAILEHDGIGGVRILPPAWYRRGGER